MRSMDLEAIEQRALDVREAVNAEHTPMGRMIAWSGAAAIVREDVPWLVAEVRRLRRNSTANYGATGTATLAEVAPDAE